MNNVTALIAKTSSQRTPASPSVAYVDCPWRDDWWLLSRVCELVGAFETPFFLIGLVGNLWTLYVIARTNIAAIVEVRIYFVVIFGSDFLLQFTSGIDHYSSNLVALFARKYWSISILGQINCRVLR